MPGAEGKSGFDLDADFIERYESAIVRAVNDKAADGDRLQSTKALPHPILRGDTLELQRSAPHRSHCLCRQGPDRFLVRRGAEKKRHAPAFAARIHKADGNFFGAEPFGKYAGHAPRRVFIGRKGCQCGIGCSHGLFRNSLKDRWFSKFYTQFTA
jgi:hypothetical protein